MGVYRVLTQFVNRVPSQGFGGSKPPPYGVRFICLPVENVAFGTVLPEGKRDDTRVHSLPQSRPLADPAPSEREPWVRAFIISTIPSLQARAKSLPLVGEGAPQGRMR